MGTTNKSNSAHQIAAALARESKPIVVRQKGTKRVAYRGYEIKIIPALVQGGALWCIVGKDDYGLAFRRSTEECKAFIDAKLRATTPRIKCKVKKAVIIDCPKCGGEGLYKNKVCPICKGNGEIKE